jgi:zinc protease
MYQFFPDATLARRAQIFEIWIRPVRPEQTVVAIKIALHELRALIADGLTARDFEDTREYLSKNVFVMTKNQDQQLGYALDSRWYGIGEFTAYMREQLAALTVERVNAAIRRHLSGDNLHIVAITADAEGLRDELLSGAFTPIAYDAAKPAELLAEDQVIGAMALGIRPEAIRITPVASVFVE